jgi:putative membrane protein insertion efficiency factor
MSRLGAAWPLLVRLGRFLLRVPVLVLTLLVRGYQLFVSPLLGPRGRFYPSCSAYALTALQRHGAVRGTWLAVCRLARCHPWNPGGVDHVPPAAARRAGDPASQPPSSVLPPVAPAAGHHPADDPALPGRTVA